MKQLRQVKQQNANQHHYSWREEKSIDQHNGGPELSYEFLYLLGLMLALRQVT
jgi:hypothetical protein